MEHREALVKCLCSALSDYIVTNGGQIPAFEIIGALDYVAGYIMEAVIRDYPEMVPELSAIMKAHQTRLH